MIVSSEKANRLAAKAVSFAASHKWAKLPCLGAVSAVYAADLAAAVVRDAADKLAESARAPFRPLAARAAAFLLAGSFVFMVSPFTAMEVSANTPVLAPQIEPESFQSAAKIADTEEEIAEMVHMEGLCEGNADYRIKLNINTLKKDVTARFSYRKNLLPTVKSFFKRYEIPTDNLNIAPMDITLYVTETKQIVDLAEGYSADITLPVPESMDGHTDDLKIVRLEDNGMMTIIDGEISDGENGRIISFNTEHFSVFALVCYSEPVETEDVASGAGAAASGVTADITPSLGTPVLREDERRRREHRGKRIYRIKRIAKEGQLLLL